MLCKKIRNFVSPYLDSELDSHTNMEIGEHLENCSESGWVR
jgi:predicted anti-sigma-YlaC factor YlaD